MSCSFDPKQIRVALLAGGKSGERSISLASGEGAKEALLEAGFPVTVFDPANKEDLLALIQGDFDVAFLALHGKYGEDGTIQGFLETIGLPYIGPGVWSSATSIDKPKTKLCYERAGIPTPRSMMLDSHHIDIDAIIAEVGSHCVVKAATEGSALGVYLCEGAEEIADAIDRGNSLLAEAEKKFHFILPAGIMPGIRGRVHRCRIGQRGPVRSPCYQNCSFPRVLRF